MIATTQEMVPRNTTAPKALTTKSLPCTIAYRLYVPGALSPNTVGTLRPDDI